MKNLEYKDFTSVATPAYIVDEKSLIKNLEKLKMIIDRTGCKILLAQKAFSMYSVYPLISNYLNGTTASSLHEARLGKEEMKGETHIYSPAFKKEEIKEILSYVDHIVFNSFSQWIKYKEELRQCGKPISPGLRINPEYSEVETELYNPCSKNSRMGITIDQFDESKLDGIEGLHFHTLCEQNSDTLYRTLQKVEEKFGVYLGKMKWVNFGGGHHITRDDYDVELLIECILHIQNTYGVQVYLEPGEAIALNAGYLVSEVLAVLDRKNAIMDTSAACHMPDVLEMPYTPKIIGTCEEGQKGHSYMLGGPTCLAGDVIGTYEFPDVLQEGDKLIFTDMAIYTMVKNNTFNGVNLPAIMYYTKEGKMQTVKTFGYHDFKSRL